jgi:hypothetical protein
MAAREAASGREVDPEEEGLAEVGQVGAASAVEAEGLEEAVEVAEEVVVGAAAEVVAGDSEAAGSAISATSSLTNPMARSSGPAETVP